MEKFRAIYSVSGERIRQIEVKAFNKLRLSEQVAPGAQERKRMATPKHKLKWLSNGRVQDN